MVKTLTNTKEGEEETMKLELSIMAGAESKAFLADLTKILTRMESLTGTGTGTQPAPARRGRPPKQQPTQETETYEEEEFETAPDTDDTEESENEESVDEADENEDTQEEETSFEDAGDEEEETPPKKVAKTKVTKTDLDAAANAWHRRLAGSTKDPDKTKKAFKKIKSLLEANFGVTSFAMIEKADYPKVLKFIQKQMK